MTEPPQCPVCTKTFENEAGRGSHLAVMKDTAHTAYRNLGHVPDQRAPLLLPPGPTQPAEGVERPGPLPKVEALPVQPFQALPQRKEQAATEPLEVTFDLPSDLQPLLPEGAKLEAPTGPPGQPLPNAVKIEVPLAPFIAGATAVAANGFFLRAEADGKVSPQEVTDCGFSAAAEACLRFYFPDISWEHPVVALIASSVALATIIASKKAPKDQRQEPRPSHEKEGSEPVSLAPSEPTSSLTGDRYWDSILAQAQGGVPSDD